MKLTRIFSVGRYENKNDKRQVNVKKGKCARNYDHYFYLLRGSRVFIMQGELSRDWKHIGHAI